jgi:hypothetical protein
MNMNITGVCRVLAVSGIVAGMMGVPAAQASPIEHAVDAADVSTGYVNLAYGDHTVNAALGNALEVDSYRFSANAGDQIKLLFRSTGYMDPSVQLRDSTGTLVKSATCGGGYYGCSSSFDQTIATTGIYTLNISDSGGDEGGDYELHL